MTDNSRKEARYLVSIVDAWMRGRKDESKAFTLRGFRGFAEFMNSQCRQLISFCDRKDPEFYEALAELCNQAATMTTPGARTIADGRDVTNL